MIASHLNLIVPCFNEEAVLEETAFQLLELLDSMQANGLAGRHSGITFVDDGHWPFFL